jgi:hypothetical protein
MASDFSVEWQSSAFQSEIHLATMRLLNTRPKESKFSLVKLLLKSRPRVVELNVNVELGVVQLEVYIPLRPGTMLRC